MSITLTLNNSYNIGENVRSVAASANGAYLFALIENDGVYVSTNSGSSWTKTYSAGSVQLTSISCSSDGAIVYFCWVGGGLFKSTDYGQNFTQIASYASDLNCTPTDGGPYIRNFICDTTGNKVAMSLQGGSTYVYLCSNFAAVSKSWTAVQIVGPSQYIFSICCNSDASILYAIVGPDSSPSGTGGNIYTSTNSGSTWSLLPGSSTSNWGNLACDSTGTKLYATVTSVGLYIFSPSTGSPQLISSPSTTAFGPLATHTSGAKLLTGQSFTAYTYTVNYVPTPTPTTMCFKEDSKILCFVDGVEKYVPVQNIRPGTLVKTLTSGYVPVNMIGSSKMYNDGSNSRGINKLYKFTQKNYKEITEDLIITGCHSVLVDSLTDVQADATREIVGRILITENKYRLMAALDHNAEPFLEEGVFPIWHLALDHEDERMNYGVYANGLLVETTSKRMLREYSGMKLV